MIKIEKICFDLSYRYNEIVCFRTRMQEAAKWRRKDRHLQHSEHIQLTPEQREVGKYRIPSYL